MMQYYLPLLRYNEDARRAFIKVSNYSPNASQMFDEMVSFGSGPWITPTRPDEASGMRVDSKNSEGSAVHEDYPSNVFIDKNVLDQFEKSVNAALAGGDWETVARQMLVVSFNIMHEAGGHWNYMNTFGGDEMRRTFNKGLEHGNLFIEKVFGADMLKRNLYGAYTTNVDKVKNLFYNQYVNNFKTVGMTLHSFSAAAKIFGKSTPETKGQKGDPSVTDDDRKNGPYKIKSPRTL